MRYYVSAATATGTDYAVFSLCNYSDQINFDPVLSTFMGAAAGGFVSFFLGRNWTYMNREGRISEQGLKFILVVVGSILLSTFGMHIATNTLDVGATLSQGLFEISGLKIDKDLTARMLVSMFMGACYNFPMHRYFVFR